MLKTLGSLPVDRIHAMLSTYVDDYSLSVSDLTKFLNSLVKEDRLECKASLYSLKK